MQAVELERLPWDIAGSLRLALSSLFVGFLGRWTRACIHAGMHHEAYYPEDGSWTLDFFYLVSDSVLLYAASAFFIWVVLPASKPTNALLASGTFVAVVGRLVVYDGADLGGLLLWGFPGATTLAVMAVWLWTFVVLPGVRWVWDLRAGVARVEMPLAKQRVEAS